MSEREHVPNSEGCFEGKLFVSGSDTAEIKVTETSNRVILNNSMIHPSKDSMGSCIWNLNRNGQSNMVKIRKC